MGGAPARWKPDLTEWWSLSQSERGSGREKFCSWSPQILCLKKFYAEAIIFSSALRASEARHDQAEMKYRSDCNPPLNVVQRI